MKTVYLPFAFLTVLMTSPDIGHATDRTLATGLATAGSLATGSLPGDVVAPTFAEFDDPPFAVYVDVADVARAIKSGDTALLTDAALQCVEGERVLRRPHRAMSADQVVEAALRLALFKQDQASLDRLRRYADASGNTALARRLTAELTSTAGSRDHTTARVSVDEVAPDDFRRIHDLCKAMEVAAAAGDGDVLAACKRQIEEWDGSLAESLRAAIARLEPLLENDEQSGLQRLLAASRALDFKGRYAAGQHFSAAGERVYFFAVELWGPLNRDYAQGAFWTAVNEIKDGYRGTLYAERITFRSSSDRSLLIGWYNANRDEGGWIAARTDGTRPRLVVNGPWYQQRARTEMDRYIQFCSDGHGQITRHNGWLIRRYSTRGFTLVLQVCNDGTNLAAEFIPPR